MSSSGGAVVVAMARRAERAVVQTLREHGATSADRAAPLSLNRPGGRAAVKRLVRREAVRESGDRYWLDEAAYETMRDGRRVRAVFAMIVVAAIVIAIIAFGAFRA
ncbi:hypothetical protein [Brevundimonas sp.]|uniref:hypothetical protein n=1 Tax=Brevundimonas sp. TaxID=1871086 RepID=UPI002730A6A7|nr:hypothetical protein [Brevundimonas sp.]MDP1912017.1 hypothetical protein [Brevundimonas sp.]